MGCPDTRIGCWTALVALVLGLSVSVCGQNAEPGAAPKALVTRDDYSREIERLQTEQDGLQLQMDELETLCRLFEEKQVLFVRDYFIQQFGLNPNDVGRPLEGEWRIVQRDKFSEQVAGAMAHGLGQTGMTTKRAEQYLALLGRINRGFVEELKREMKDVEEKQRQNRQWLSYYIDQRSKLPGEGAPTVGGSGSPTPSPANALVMVEGETKTDAEGRQGSESQYVHWDSITGTSAKASGKSLNKGATVDVSVDGLPKILLPDTPAKVTITVSATLPDQQAFQTAVWIEAGIMGTNVEIKPVGKDPQAKPLAGFFQKDGKIEVVSPGSQVYEITLKSGHTDATLTTYIGAVGPMATHVYRVNP